MKDVICKFKRQDLSNCAQRFTTLFFIENTFSFQLNTADDIIYEITVCVRRVKRSHVSKSKLFILPMRFTRNYLLCFPSRTSENREQFRHIINIITTRISALYTYARHTSKQLQRFNLSA